jgi:hypothetical protein
MLILLRFFQQFAIAGLIAVSPLLIGFLFFSYTQSLGLQFGVTSLTVLLWHVAICLVDIVIQAISDTLFAPITATNVVLLGGNLIIVNNWLMFPFIMAFAAFITVFFYLSVPFVASAVMRGLSGTTATLRAGLQGAMQTAGLLVGTGLTAAGAAVTFGGSVAAQAAIERTRAAAEGAPAAGRIASDLAAAGGFAPGYSDSGGSDLPEPPHLVPATVGEKLQNRSNPNQIAHQTAPDSFTVADSVQGTISYHMGNIYTPYAAQAAFNSHASKAQKGPPPLPADKPA